MFPFESLATPMDSERVPSVSWICCAPKTETHHRLLVQVGLDTTGRGSSFARGTIHRSSANRPDWMPCLFPSAQEIQSFRYLGICRISCRMGIWPHELFARFYDGDAEVFMAWLSEWTQAQEPASIIVADVQPIALLRTEWQHVPLCRLLRRCALCIS